MSKLDNAVARLEHAARRLEAAERNFCRARPETEHRALREIAGQIAARVDNALARIDLALREEG
jgi:hypothetical protein